MPWGAQALDELWIVRVTRVVCAESVWLASVDDASGGGGGGGGQPAAAEQPPAAEQPQHVKQQKFNCKVGNFALARETILARLTKDSYTTISHFPPELLRDKIITKVGPPHCTRPCRRL